jgi:peptidyl-prolyl cis-trans isomerase D
MKDFMTRHRAQFETDQPSRTIDYVVYDVLPGSDDTVKALGALQQIRDQFATATDNEVFVNRNSEERYTDAYVNKSRYMSPMADTILSGGVGSVYGPFFDAGTYKLVKVVERRQLPDSVRAQHILIATASQQNPQGLADTLAHKRADSILAAVNSGVPFDSLAAKFSDDPGSKVKGGDLGYFGYGMMVPEFNEAAFMGAKGDMKVVKTQFGWHIIRVTDQKNFAPAVKLATITKTLNIGAKADQAQFAKANEFAGRNRTGAAFDAAVKKEGISKRVAEDVKPGDFVIQGLGASRDIIRWAYGAKQGEVSDPIHLDNKYVVAKVAAVNEPGLKSLDAATKMQVEAQVRAEKKTKMLADQYKNVQSLEALAQQSGQQVMVADSINGAASFAEGVGYEPKVIGYAFYEKLQPGAVSPAIKGRDGVFFISLTHRSANTAPTDPMAMKTQAAMQDMQTKNYIQQAITQSLRRQSKVSINAENIF